MEPVLEALVGLIIEVMFIATLIRRFFNWYVPWPLNSRMLILVTASRNKYTYACPPTTPQGIATIVATPKF